MSRVMRPAAAVDYPYSDGRPMAESEAQRRAILSLVSALYGHFRDREDVYAGADMFIYYERGNPEAVVAPDVFVVVGCCFSLSLVGSPRELTGLFRRRNSGDDGAIREPNRETH